MKLGMLIDLNRCIGCGACAMACKVENATERHVYWKTVMCTEVGKYPDAKMSVWPTSCMQCENAPCVRACPTGASHYDENRVVQVDFNKCIGCRMCVAACPYNARFFNWGDMADNPYFEGQGQTPLEAKRSSEHPKGVVEKCTFCRERVSENREPACVETCPTKAHLFGDLDDPDSEINKKILELKAYVFKPEYGTEPKVYYAGRK